MPLLRQMANGSAISHGRYRSLLCDAGGDPVRTDSRQINYLSVYEFLAPQLADPDLIPGTPAWVQLDDADSAKWRAVLWAAVWWSLDQDTHQAAAAAASKAIAAAEDWPAVARHIHRGRGAAYIPRRREIA